MKYRVYKNGNIDGVFSAKELCDLPDFSLNILVCPENEIGWIEADQIPDIVQAMAQASSDDYKPQSLTAMSRFHTWVSTISEFALAVSPPEHRRKILLIMVGFVSIGIYYPTSENLSAFLIEMKTNDAAILPMGARFHKESAPHAGESWRRNALKKNSHAAGKPADSIVPPSQNTTEIGTEDLGNGLLLKTIVITEVRDGVRTQRTTTLTVQTHPHKARIRRRS